MAGCKWFGKKECGFTFTELAVVIAIIAALMATAIPTVINWMPEYRLKKAARDLYSNMQSARLQAVRANDACRIVFNIGPPDTYQIQSPGPNGVWGGGDDIVSVPVTLADYGSGISFGWGGATQDVNGAAFGSPVTFGGNTAEFTGTGALIDATANPYVYIQNDEGATFAVGALSTGVILMQKWYPASATWE